MDEFCKPIIERIEAKKVIAADSDFSIRDGILFHSKVVKHLADDEFDIRVVVPKLYQETMIHAVHNSALGGHTWSEKTFNTLDRNYYWPTMHADVEEFCRSCEQCQFAKAHQNHNLGELQDFQPRQRAHTISMDHVGPISPPADGGSVYLLILMCSFTHYAWSFGTKTQGADEVASILFFEFICKGFIPQVILTDNGKAFRSSLIASIVALMKSRHVFTAPYHPETNGLNESSHK